MDRGVWWATLHRSRRVDKTAQRSTEMSSAFTSPDLCPCLFLLPKVPALSSLPVSPPLFSASCEPCTPLLHFYQLFPSACLLACRPWELLDSHQAALRVDSRTGPVTLAAPGNACERMNAPAGEGPCAQTDPSRGAEAWPPSLLHWGRLGGCSKAGWPDLPEGPSGASTRAGRRGQGVRADTPPAVSPAPGRGRCSVGPRPAARRAGSLAQARCRGWRIRAALPLARPASFLPAEPRASRAWPLPPSPPPRPPPPSRSRPTRHPARRSCWGGVRAGRSPGRAAVGATPPGQRSLPPQPACGRRSLRGVERGDLLRRPEPASGAAPGSRRDVPASSLGGGVRKRNSAGAAPATLFPPPRLPPAPSPPPFFPPRPGPRGHPPASVWPSLLPLLSHPDLFVPHHPGTPAPLPSPLAAWTVRQAADAARSEVARTAVPRER